MGAGILFLLGTLATWAGWFFAFRALWFAVKAWTRPGEAPREQYGRKAALSAAAAGVLLVLAATLPIPLGRPAPGPGWQFPIVWVLMPFVGWMVVIGLAMVAVRLGQAIFALNADERKQRLLQAGAWTIFGVVGYWLFGRVNGEVQIFRGSIPFSPTVAIGLVALAAAAIVAMALAGRFASSRGASKVVAAHLALIAGSIIFGLPFAWLVITSFKEDRDMSSAAGIVWVPRISHTVDYKDPKDPVYEGTMDGNRVTGTIIARQPDGQVQVDVLTPFAMRGRTLVTTMEQLREVPKQVPVVTGRYAGQDVKGKVIEELADGKRRVQIMEPANLAGTTFDAAQKEVEAVRSFGLRWQNYSEALQYLPPETNYGLLYLRNTLILVVMSVIGTVLSSALVAYGFSRLRFPGKNVLFLVLLSTMMLPGAVTLLPSFLIFRALGWIDTLYPLWVPAFFAGAFNVFLLRQFFLTIPMELEDAAKIDGCTYLRTFWQVMMPQVKPALAVIAIWTIMGAWNNFMGPLIYINSPENMPLAYAVQLFQGERGGEPGLMMAFATMAMLPVLALFFFAQKYFIEGVTLSGLGGR